MKTHQKQLSGPNENLKSNYVVRIKTIIYNCILVIIRTGRSAHGERANFTGLVLGCVEAKFCKYSPRSIQYTPLHRFGIRSRNASASEPGKSAHGERANFTGLVLCCIETTFLKKILV